MTFYWAANYFVEALCNTPSYSVSYDHVTYLTSVASKEINKFIKRRNQNCIFEKCPDVFILKEDSVALTDQFLSLYKFKQTLDLPQFSGKGNYLHICALQYFHKILKSHGKRKKESNSQQFFSLFRVLANDVTQPFSKHFCQYSETDALNFFQTYSDIFSVDNGFVSLIEKKQKVFLNPLLSQTQRAALRTVLDSVYFLLNCFKSLHFIELKQCISYVEENAGCKLDQYPLILQRSWFEKLKFAKMDEFGFLKLKKIHSALSITNRQKTILVVVCILAFEKEMPFQKIIEEVECRVSSTVNIFCNKSLEEQLGFFKQHPQYFHVCSKENVTLLPSFFCPVCILRPQINSNQSTTVQNCIPSVLEVSNTRSSSLPHKTANESEVKQKYCELSEELIPEIIFNKLHGSVHMFRAYFVHFTIEHILEASLIALNVLYKYYRKLSSTQQYQFIEICYKFIVTETLHDALSDGCKTRIGDKKKNILVIAYLLLMEKELHYKSIIKQLKNCHFQNSKPSLHELGNEGQLGYFRMKSEYFTIKDVYVTLNHNRKSAVTSVITSFLKDSKINQSDVLQSSSANRVQYSVTLSQENSTFEPARNSVELSSIQSESDTKDVITDLCVYLLTTFKALPVEKLCDQLCFCSSIREYFSFFTLSEKIQFFKDLSQYFGVNKDDFVSLKENISNTYVPKTKFYSPELLSLSASISSTFSESFPVQSVTSDKDKGKQKLHKKLQKALSKIDANLDGHKDKSNSEDKSRLTLENEDLEPQIKYSGFQMSHDATNVEDNQQAIQQVLSLSYPICTINSIMEEEVKFKSETFSVCSNKSNICRQPVQKSSGEMYGSCLTLCKDSLTATTSSSCTIMSNFNTLKNPLVIQNTVSDELSPHNLKTFKGNEGVSFSIRNNLKYMSKYEVSHKKSISECENSLVASLKLDCSACNSSGFKNTSVNQNIEASKRSHSFLPEGGDIHKTSSDPKPSVQKLSSEVPPILEAFCCSSVPGESSMITKSNLSIESRAVNFFSVLLRNYRQGVPAEDFKRHISLASKDVQIYMYNRFRNDFLEFFQKHKKVFYISSESNTVYLLRNKPK